MVADEARRLIDSLMIESVGQGAWGNPTSKGKRERERNRTE